MSSGTLVNFTQTTLSTHRVGQLNMLDCKMSSSLSPVAPVNILSECYIGMWDTEMAQPPPTKLETTDIMDLIEPSLNGNGGGLHGTEGIKPGGASPTAIIHHTGEVRHHSQSEGQEVNAYPTISTTSSSPSNSSTTSSYLAPLPSLGDPYGTNGTECHLLDGFHGAFQEGGYDAFLSELSHPPTVDQLNGGHHNQHHHQLDQSSHHHQQHHTQQIHHPHVPQIPSHPHLQNVGGLNQCHDNNSGVLLLEMNSHHPHIHGSSSQCSPDCGCASNPYSMGGDNLREFCPPPGALNQHGHALTHPTHHHHHNPHQQNYSSAWDDLQCESMLFRKGDSPTAASDSVSYTDNDSESKSSGGSLSGINEIVHVSPPKRKVGRPPKMNKKLKRNEKKTGRLWEFIRNLLKNPEYCPSLVKWENHEEGHFRFVNSEKVAQLWGQIKGNPRMNYEKLSRAMRYYYKSHVFEPVLGRRLVYKFGYNATNWKVINPNFASSHPKIYN